MENAFSELRLLAAMEESGLDRLSNLPDSLLLHIMGSLETLDAVRTAILSKRWTNLWRSLPILDFSDREFVHVAENSPQTEFSFSVFFTQVLTRRDDSKLLKVRVATESKIEPSLLESLFKYAVEHGVQEISLHMRNLPCPHFPCPFEIPLWFVNCQSLQKFELATEPRSCFPRDLGSNALKSLYLEGIYLSKDIAEGRLFWSCTNLETLQLVDVACGKYDFFNIQSPCLIKLELASTLTPGCDCEIVIVAPRLTSFKFRGEFAMNFSVDASSLEDVYIDLHTPPYEDILDGYYEELALETIQMVNEFHAAKSIIMSMETIEVLSTHPDLLDGRLSKVANLKCLTIDHKFAKYFVSQDFVLPPCLQNYFLNGSTALKVIPK